MLQPSQLDTLNTLKLPCTATGLLDIDSVDSLHSAVDRYALTPSNCFVLGEGSNIVLPTQLNRIALRLNMKDLSFESLGDGVWELEAGAGVSWDSVVAACVERGLYGIENLSWIPGTMGAAPVQNIGAYGVELKDVLSELWAYDLVERRLVRFSQQACHFAYRESVFKSKPGRYVITSVRLKLSDQKKFNLDYGPLQCLVDSADLSLKKVRETVISIRQEKIPDPRKIPNAGSFFKNPVISHPDFEDLKKRFPGVVSFPVSLDQTKLAAAWLIDQAGWKGFRNESVGVHDQQALVLVNHNHGNQENVLSLAKQIQESVKDTYGVELEIEPRILSN